MGRTVLCDYANANDQPHNLNSGSVCVYDTVWLRVVACIVAPPPRQAEQVRVAPT